MTKTKLLKAILFCFIYISFLSVNAAENNTTETYVETLTDADAEAIAANKSATDVSKDSEAEPLNKIAANTYAALKALNSFILSWLSPDESKSTQELASDFFNYFKYKFENKEVQISSQPALLEWLVTPNKKDLNYTTLLGNVKDDEKDEASKSAALRYTRFSSGANLSHKKISKIQNEAAAIMFQNLNLTSTSIQTYNSYLMGKQYANYLNEKKLSETQYKLQDKASSEDWLLDVATEKSIGIILRQLLLFTSQIYLLNLELVNSQNEQLAATAMTNSLLIISNQKWENELYNYAVTNKIWPYSN
ncbi:hypothetical protein N9L02_00825 [Gammaproteobacteria bacterium]|nr:hypothetical protein [Gammaproteobacteria bacterium]